MGNLFDDLSTEEQETAKAFASEHKIGLEIATVIIRSSDVADERLKALKVMRAAAKAAKSPAGTEARKKELADKINGYTEELKKYEEARNVPMMVKVRNLQQVAVQELKALG